MVWIARALGALLVAFGLAGVFAVWTAQGQAYPMPLWNGAAWSGEARALADWATYSALALGGLALVLRQGAAAWLFGLALLLAAARTGYDVTLGDPETARRTVMLHGDFIALGAAIIGLGAFAIAGRRPRPSVS